MLSTPPIVKSTAANNARPTPLTSFTSTPSGSGSSVISLFFLEWVRRGPLRGLGLECFLDLEQRLALLLGDRGEARVDLHQRVRQHRAHTDPPEPLPVSRNHIPRPPLPTRVRQHVGERLLVVVPALPLADVGRRELPV